MMCRIARANLIYFIKNSNFGERALSSSGEVAGWWDIPVATYLSEKLAIYEKEETEEKLI